MSTKMDSRRWKIIGLVIVLIISSACNLTIPVFKDVMSFIVRGNTPIPERTETPQPTSTDEPIEMIDEGAQADAPHCDAVHYIEIDHPSNPYESSRDDGSYTCSLEITLVNSHPTNAIAVSWKHDDSSSDRGPYWTHPELQPGQSYVFYVEYKRTANGKVSTLDANNLMAWFATSACGSFVNQFWGTLEEPDRLLTSDLNRVELPNPCSR